MFDKKTLSKQKYIYTAYISSDGILHVEKFPVIYINKTLVYYKRPGIDTLGCKSIKDVYDSFKSLPYEKINTLYYYSYQTVLFWSAKDTPKTIEELKLRYEEEKYKKEKEETEQKVKEAKRIYEATLEQYKKKYGET